MHTSNDSVIVYNFGVDIENEQLALVARSIRKTKAKPVPEPALIDPVARVMVDISLPHLDRPFDYLVPEAMSQTAVPGVRVRVRFSGSLVDGWILERCAASDHSGRLERIAKVVSPEPALTPQILRLCRDVADYYAGTLPDVVRAAVPTRHAAAEAALAAKPAPEHPALPPIPESTSWSRYTGGPALLSRLVMGDPYSPTTPGPRAVWVAAAATDPAEQIRELAHTAALAGRGVLIVVPDARDVARLDAALSAELGPQQHVVLTADLGPSVRYSAFLRIRRGEVRVVVGTRAAVFAPVADLGLIVLWDDSDDSHAEPHAPYWHAREVLVMRANTTGSAMVVGSTSRSVEAAALVSSGWARNVVEPRTAARASAPRIITIGGDVEQARDEAAMTARLPNIAWQTAKRGLEVGPVLVQVPRRGYVPSLSCQTCRRAATCSSCHGPVGVTSGSAIAACTWCGRLAGDWVCPSCKGRALRAMSFGERRTAEELGRAFPGVVVRTSGRDSSGAGVLDEVDDAPALIVATPGAEPRVAGGYAAALLLDGRVMLDRPDLRAAQEAVSRWFAAISLVRSANDGGAVVLVADPTLAAVQAIVRNDPVGFSDRELMERDAVRLPPHYRVAELTGQQRDIADLIAQAKLPAHAQVLGPVPVPVSRSKRPVPGEAVVRALVVVPSAVGSELSAALAAGSAVRSARKEGAPVTVRIDPIVLG